MHQTNLQAIWLTLAALSLIAVSSWYSRRLKMRNKELEHLINKRTVELKDLKLQLLEANRAKRNFLESMSHEIRTPLNGIVGIARLLSDKPDNQNPYPNEIKHLYTCSTHLHQLLCQTLDYSSLEAGRLRLSVESFDPSLLFNEVIETQSDLAQERGIELILTKPKIPYRWKGDPVLLRQTLIHLLSNGIKYTPDGSVNLIVNYTEQEDSIEVCIEVIDTGPGIPIDQQTAIFEEYTRPPEVEESLFSGAGLGLIISSKMAQLMGGSLTLDTDYKDGARFILDLEFGIDLYSPKNDSHKGQDILKGKRALIADDIEINRYIISSVLKSMGAKTDKAEDGLAALKLLQESTYDIVILDISMPKMTGPEVVEAFFSEPHSSAPEFIALSAYNNPENEATCIAAGFKHFMEKPLDPEKLKNLLHHHHCGSPNNDDRDLLSYLSANSTKSLKELQMEYKNAFNKELVNLRVAVIKKEHNNQRELIHKLLGMCGIYKNAATKKMVETISKKLKDRVSEDRILILIKKLQTFIDRELG